MEMLLAGAALFPRSGSLLHARRRRRRPPLNPKPCRRRAVSDNNNVTIIYLLEETTDNNGESMRTPLCTTASPTIINNYLLSLSLSRAI